MTSLTVTLVVVGAGLLALAWLRRRYCTVRVDGPSMQPTLHSGDVVLVTRHRPVRSGQIVVVEQPVHTEAGWYWRPRARQRRPARLADRQWSVKRAVAVAGDQVPPDLLDAVAAQQGARVPEGKLLVLGDNTALSIDSRQWGYLPIHSLLGVVASTRLAMSSR